MVTYFPDSIAINVYAKIAFEYFFDGISAEKL